jgi:hypothetical protein
MREALRFETSIGSDGRVVTRVLTGQVIADATADDSRERRVDVGDEGEGETIHVHIVELGYKPGGFEIGIRVAGDTDPSGASIEKGSKGGAVEGGWWERRIDAPKRSEQ